MNASEYSYGVGWQYLQSKGWTIVPSDLPVGTAAADGINRKILMKPSAFAAPNLRVRRYVIPHEVWHGVHYELMRWKCDKLMQERSLTYKSAREVVADGACLAGDKSRAMRAWVLGSVAWHGKVGYNYSFADLRSPAALEAIGALLAEVNNWKAFSKEAEKLS